MKSKRVGTSLAADRVSRPSTDSAVAASGAPTIKISAAFRPGIPKGREDSLDSPKLKHGGPRRSSLPKSRSNSLRPVGYAREERRGIISIPQGNGNTGLSTYWTLPREHRFDCKISALT